MSVDEHPFWVKLDFDEMRFLEYLPMYASQNACARSIGRDGGWLGNRKRKKGFRELIALRRAGSPDGIPSYSAVMGLRAQLELELIMEQDLDRKVRAMAARALRGRA